MPASRAAHAFDAVARPLDLPGEREHVGREPRLDQRGAVWMCRALLQDRRQVAERAHEQRNAMR